MPGVAAMCVLGLVLLMGWIGWEGTDDTDGFQEDQEFGAGLLTGGLVGGALLLIDERRESERASRDRQLVTEQAERETQRSRLPRCGTRSVPL